ncbi:hypothetical protein, partial [Bacteroides ovatus]|uniref:hypothetical protein n=1 Tax=Bacteroides ovatus TaxID=28116 RepID=UPI001C304C4F
DQHLRGASSAASDVYKRQTLNILTLCFSPERYDSQLYPAVSIHLDVDLIFALSLRVQNASITFFTRR